MKHTSHTVRDWLEYLFEGEIEELQRLAQSLPANPVIVNIGAGGGTSGLAFMESRGDVILYTVDIQNESSPHGCLAGERAVFHDAGFGDLLDVRWFQIHGDSKAVGRAWNRPPVDLVFVDGSHDEMDVRGDIEAWLPHVKPDGLMVLHDYGDRWPGVMAAVGVVFGSQEPVARLSSLIAFQVEPQERPARKRATRRKKA